MTKQWVCAIAFALVLASACPAAHTALFSNVLPAGATVRFQGVDGGGNFYVAGAYIAGAAFYPYSDLYVARISSDGASLIYFTDLGVEGGYPISMELSGMAVEPNGTACLLLMVDTQFGSWTAISMIGPTGGTDTSQTSFSGAYFGFNLITDVTADASGNLYFSGLALTANDTASMGVFKLDPTATKLLWQFNGYGGSLAVDSEGNVYIQGLVNAGQTITSSPSAYESTYHDSCGSSGCAHQYVAEIDKTGSRVLYATYLTGSYNDSASGIAVDTAGNAYVAGYTDSPDYPTTANALDDVFPALAPANFQTFAETGYPRPVTGYISSLDAAGALRYSTFFGGSAADVLTGIAVDSTNNVLYVSGDAASTDLPGLAGADHHCIPRTFISQLPADGSGVGRSVPVPNLEAFSVAGNGRVVFATGSALDETNFGTKDTPIACLANSADLSAATSAVPGQLLTVFGNGLAVSAAAATAAAGLYPASLEGLSITMNGLPAPLLYVSPDQVNLQVPFEIAGQTEVTLQLQSVSQDGTAFTDSRSVPVLAAGPIVFERMLAPGECPGSYPGEIQTAAINQDGSVNGCANPAAVGSIVTIFVDGLGNLAPSSLTGANNAAAVPLTAAVSFTSYSPLPLPALVTANAPAGWITGLYAVQIQAPAGGAPATLVIGQTDAQGPISIAVAP